MRSSIWASGLNLVELLESPGHEGFLSRFRRQSFARGRMVSIPGAPGNDVFVVLSGTLRVYLSDEWREFTLCFLEKGGIFATHTTAFVEAAKDSELLLLDTMTFYREALKYPEVMSRVTGGLGDVLKGSWDVVGSLAFHDVRSRLLAFIVSMGREHGRAGVQGIEYDCELSMEDISQIIGTTRQTTSSLFNELIRDGELIRKSRGRYVIADIDRLASGLPGQKTQPDPPNRRQAMR